MNLEQLQKDIETQKEIFKRNSLLANKAINDLPEGEQKNKLKNIMKLAKSGKINSSNISTIMDQLKDIQNGR